jgi:hypothetical protein
MDQTKTRCGPCMMSYVLIVVHVAMAIASLFDDQKMEPWECLSCLRVCRSPLPQGAGHLEARLAVGEAGGRGVRDLPGRIPGWDHEEGEHGWCVRILY